MPYLIDGHNLIPKIPGLSLEDVDDERKLIELLQDFCRWARKGVEVYFDNAPAGESRLQRYGQVLAHFVRQGSSADAAIRLRLKRSGKQAADWIVVSSDREIQASARQARATVLSSEQFASLLRQAFASSQDAPEIAQGTGLSAEELEAWLKLFGED
jgi:predicted RNA-binding protein with PIN domain